MELSNATAANSLFSNGICEKNHEIVDIMISKIKSSDPSISDQEALDHALHAKNVEVNNKGFSPFQIVYRENPRIPGISNSTPSSISTNFASEDVRKHIHNVQLAREAFRTSDNDDNEIKKCLRSKIYSSNNYYFFNGDIVYFKEKDKIE